MITWAQNIRLTMYNIIALNVNFKTLINSTTIVIELYSMTIVIELISFTSWS